MMDACGEAEGRLASELMQHELQLEKDILDPVNHLAEVRVSNPVLTVHVMRCVMAIWRKTKKPNHCLSPPDLQASLFLFQVEIPNILKQRKQLAKLVLDYDSAKTRYPVCQIVTC